MDIHNTEYFERKRIYELIEQGIIKHKILYIHCNTGYGKTLSVLRWLDNRNEKYQYLSAEDEDFFDLLQSNEPTSPFVVLDDLSCVIDEDDKEQISKYIANSQSNFIIISRAEMPAFLTPFLITGQIEVLGKNKFAFTKAELEEILKQKQIILNDEKIQELFVKSAGFPLGIIFAVGHLRRELPFSEVYEKTKQDYFNYLDFSLYRKLTETQRNYLLDLACVMQFSIKLAIMITGVQNIDDELYELSDFNYVLTFIKPNTFKFYNDEIYEYFSQKQKLKLENKSILQLYQRIALYYELEGDFKLAMYYYDLAGNRDKLSSLLVENTRRNPLEARYNEVEKYYLELSDAQILSSPELMCGMSILHSIRFSPKESEYWYEKLKEFTNRLDRKDIRYKISKEKLVYLDIALPHRGTKNTLDVIKNAAVTVLRKRSSIQEFSATGDMPSLINGGMDFSNWAKDANFIYSVIKKPLELALGKSAVGLMETGYGEMLFEKNTDLNFTESLTYLNTALSEIILNGTKQMEFATLGVMSRIFVSSDSMSSARRLIEGYLDKVRYEPKLTMQDNIIALLTLFDLYSGDVKHVEDWFRTKSPDEFDVFYILKRMQYLVKVRIYILKGKYMEALSLLDRLKIYFESYHRPYGAIQTAILRAITNYRRKYDIWKNELNFALLKCEEYSFTRIVADEGMAVLEPLLKLDYTGDSEFYKTLVFLTRKQALLYPSYLVKEETEIVHLTEMERNVLRLMMQGMTNEKIAELLSVTIRTVKFHTGNIYSKMNVKNRAEAIIKAKKTMEF